MDGTIGGVFTNGNLKSYGISAAVEPKFFFNPNVSLGLRLEEDTLFGGKIDDDTEKFQETTLLFKWVGKFFNWINI